MLRNVERYRHHFKDHVATLMDYGNIKILDFKHPEHDMYRIRFIFEEDYYRLHISGDLGDLIACNYKNMTFDKFGDFVNNTGYFEGKVRCHSRPFYRFSDTRARAEISAYIIENELHDLIHDYGWEESNEEKLECFLDDVMSCFSDISGFDARGYEKLAELYDEAWEWVPDLGKENTEILELYMLAFKLAIAQIKTPDC